MFRCIERMAVYVNPQNKNNKSQYWLGDLVYRRAPHPVRIRKPGDGNSDPSGGEHVGAMREKSAEQFHTTSPHYPRRVHICKQRFLGITGSTPKVVEMERVWILWFSGRYFFFGRLFGSFPGDRGPACDQSLREWHLSGHPLCPRRWLDPFA